MIEDDYKTNIESPFGRVVKHHLAALSESGFFSSTFWIYRPSFQWILVVSGQN